MIPASHADGRSDAPFGGNGTTVAWIESRSNLDDNPPPRELGEYLLFEKLGQGGMGVVHRAVHRKLKRPVAIKLLPAERMTNPRAVSRFLREMEAVGRLDHPNIVRAYDAGEIDGTYYLAMELVDGIDVGQLVRGGKRLSVPDACAIISQAATGLQHAHEHGLVHRDIKPSNLLLSSQGVVKVADLGLARMWAESVADEHFTHTGEVFGTYDYMAPEQADAAHKVDIRADIYSLGCTLYRLLTGQVPFPDPPYDSVAKKITAHAHDPRPRVTQHCPETTRSLDELAARMMAKDPSQRYSQPTEVATSLESLASGGTLVELAEKAKASRTSEAEVPPGDTARVRPSPTRRISRKPSASRWRIGATLAVLVILFLSSLAVMGRRNPPADKWTAELGQKPVELLYPGYKGDGRWRIDERTDTLELTSDQIRLIKLGELTGEPCQIEIDIHQPVWAGSVGLFFGYRPRPGATNAAVQFQLIQLVRSVNKDKRSTFNLARELTSIEPPSLSMPTYGIPSSESVSFPPNGQPQRLVITIGAGGLTHVSWGGREIGRLVKNNVNAQFGTADYRGPWGLYQHHGTTWFSRSRITLLEENQ